MMLTNQNTVLTLIDVQEKLVPAMHEKDLLIDQLKKLIRGITCMGLPVLWLEQYPKGLGPTIPEVAELLHGTTAIEKISFSAWGSAEYRQELQRLERPNVLIAGIESHICVYQTAYDLLNEGYQTEVIIDATTSRTNANHKIGVDRMSRLGAALTSVEMSLFELVKSAKSANFKTIANLVK
tara:strand:- start:15 stop:557 length:543 start_codon:yes stop_codon:yes gene_type:complete